MFRHTLLSVKFADCEKFSGNKDYMKSDFCHLKNRMVNKENE